MKPIGSRQKCNPWSHQSTVVITVARRFILLTLPSRSTHLPPRTSVRAFEPSDLPAIAALLAARQRRDSDRGPAGFNANLMNPDVCERVLRENYQPVLELAVAEQAGTVVGFIGGQRMLLAPTNYAAHYVEPQSVSIPSLAHAVAEGVDATEVFRALYAFLAERWVRDGFFVHGVNTIPTDAESNEAWHSLGFGRRMTAAIREVGPVTFNGTRPEIRAGTSEDVELVFQFGTAISVHESLSPMFTPYARHTDDGMRQHIRELLAEPGTVPWLAYENDRPLGMQLFTAPGYTPFHITHERTVYLYEGIVNEEGRGNGTGTALLAHAMEWAQGEGYERCVLHFNSGNWSGAPFWLGHGFVPIEHALVRRLDTRIAWARG